MDQRTFKGTAVGGLVPTSFFVRTKQPAIPVIWFTIPQSALLQTDDAIR